MLKGFLVRRRPSEVQTKLLVDFGCLGVVVSVALGNPIQRVRNTELWSFQRVCQPRKGSPAKYR